MTHQVPSITTLWRTLVHRVEDLHRWGVIHRDIKPHNFVLTPTRGYCDARIIARTAVPKKNWVYRLVEEDNDPDRHRGDVELVLKNPNTGEEQIVPLTIKLTDFGIARPVDSTPDGRRGQLSVQGPNGTVVFMAPEVLIGFSEIHLRLQKGLFGNQRRFAFLHYALPVLFQFVPLSLFLHL